MAQIISTPEQTDMVKKLIEFYTKQNAVDGVYQQLIALFTNTLQTNQFDGNIFGTIEEEYQHFISLQ
jgi:hypothetical protein